MRRKEKVKRWRDSIRAQRLGMKFALASGVRTGILVRPEQGIELLVVAAAH